MIVVFWISFCVIIYAYFGYPILLIFLFLKKSFEENTGSDVFFQPKVSLIIPVYNEESIIE